MIGGALRGPRGAAAGVGRGFLLAAGEGSGARGEAAAADSKWWLRRRQRPGSVPSPGPGARREPRSGDWGMPGARRCRWHLGLAGGSLGRHRDAPPVSGCLRLGAVPQPGLAVRPGDLGTSGMLGAGTVPLAARVSAGRAPSPGLGLLAQGGC